MHLKVADETSNLESDDEETLGRGQRGKRNKTPNLSPKSDCPPDDQNTVPPPPKPKPTKSRPYFVLVDGSGTNLEADSEEIHVDLIEKSVTPKECDLDKNGKNFS